MLTVRIDGDLADKVIELVKEHKEKIQSGEITGFPQPVEREIADWDMVLYAFGEDDDENGE